MTEMVIRGGGRALHEQVEQHVTGAMHILSKRGDLRVTWNARDADEVEAARAQFDELRGRGFLAFAVQERTGAKGEQITEFDEHAQKLVLAPPLAGGC